LDPHDGELEERAALLQRAVDLEVGEDRPDLLVALAAGLRAEVVADREAGEKGGASSHPHVVSHRADACLEGSAPARLVVSLLVLEPGSGAIPG
jgi:hypothetical protein